MLDKIKKETKLEYNSVVRYSGNVEIITEIMGDETANMITDKQIERLDVELKKKYAENTVAHFHAKISEKNYKSEIDYQKTL